MRFPFEHKSIAPDTARNLKVISSTLFLETSAEVYAFAVATGLEEAKYRIEPTATLNATRIVYNRRLDAEDAEKAVQGILNNDASKI